MITKFGDFINEYHDPKRGNVYKVAASKTPIIGEQIFTDHGSSIFQSRFLPKSVEDGIVKINHNLDSYKAHMLAGEEKTKEWLQNANKGTTEWILKCDTFRKKLYNILERCAEFLKQYNELYSTLIEDFTSTDHVRVAKAIMKMDEIYPWQLIKDMGALKNTRKMKFDVQFFESVSKWVQQITNLYDTLTEAGKMLGKTKAQIDGARKLSNAMKSRWGEF
jgi:uncharacterized coiled-coil DUF342 family protein